MARRIQRGKRLGGNYEGVVFESTVTLKKHGKTRAILLAEKQFHAPAISPPEVLRNPKKQFEIMAGLKRLNAEKKLGLHILPTIRLRKSFGRRRLAFFLTRYKEIAELTEEQWHEVFAQRKKEDDLLVKNGYRAYHDAWKLIEDPVTKKPTYYIADFGGVEKIETAAKLLDAHAAKNVQSAAKPS